LPCSQEPATRSYPEPYESSLHPHMLVGKDPFECYPPICAFWPEFCMWVSSLSCLLHSVPISSPWFNNCHSVWWRVQIVVLLIMQVFSAFCSFLSFLCPEFFSSLCSQTTSVSLLPVRWETKFHMYWITHLFVHLSLSNGKVATDMLYFTHVEVNFKTELQRVLVESTCSLAGRDDSVQTT